MNLGMGTLSTKSVGSLSPSAIGVIYDKTLGDNIADWTLTNPTGAVTFTPSGTDYIMAGTGGTGGTNASNLFKDFIQLNTTNHSVTCLHEWKIRIDFTTGTVNAATSFGFSGGVISENSFEFRDTLCRLSQDNGLLGRFYFYNKDTSATGIADQDAPTGGFTVVSDTRYIFEIERSELSVTGRLYDSTGTTLHNTKTVTQSPPGGTVTKVLHNTGKFAIAQHGGTNTIHRVTISSEALKNVPYVCIGDSLAYGGKAADISSAFVYQSLASYQFTNLSGWADRAVDMETRIAEAVALSPDNIIIECGSNDIKATTWGSTGEAALDDMISYIQSNLPLCNIYLVSAGARNDVNVSQVETDMLTKSVSGVCRAYTITKQAANSSLLGAYNSGDGVHWNTGGHDAVATNVTYGLVVILGL